MTLEVNGSRYSVGEVGPDYVVVDSEHAVGPAHGVLIVEVDGRRITRRVSLPQGISPDLNRNRLIVLETAAPALPAGTG